VIVAWRDHPAAFALTTPIDPATTPAGGKIRRARGLLIGAHTCLADIARV
jgi:hypothetical protein